MPQKRILTMQDLSCVGRCSLTVALPVLSAYGIETCVLPTAILSNHTAFPRWSCLDLSEEAGRIMAAWRENGFRFDGFLTGYLGSPAAIDAARACFQGFSEEGAPIVIDPAFGDYGRLYPAFDRSYVAAMGDLIRSAHILLPNFTEVCFLSGTEYQSAAPPAYMKEAVVRLSRMTPAAIVMTGAESGGQTGEVIYAGSLRRCGRRCCRGAFTVPATCSPRPLRRRTCKAGTWQGPAGRPTSWSARASRPPGTRAAAASISSAPWPIFGLGRGKHLRNIPAPPQAEAGGRSVRKGFKGGGARCPQRGAGAVRPLPGRPVCDIVTQPQKARREWDARGFYHTTPDQRKGEPP